MMSYRFEEGLARLLALEDGNRLLTLLALAEGAKLSQRIFDWLTRKADGSVRRKFALAWLGPQWIENIVSFWEILRTGSARDIERNARALISPEHDSRDLEFALRNVIKPLALLERGQVAAELHDEMLNHGIQITLLAAVTLAEATSGYGGSPISTGSPRPCCHAPQPSRSIAAWRMQMSSGLGGSRPIKSGRETPQCAFR